MTPIITKFNGRNGDIQIVTPVPFTIDDVGINYMYVNKPKYEDKRSYNIFDLIRENEKLKQEKQELIKWLKDNIKLCNETINDLNKPHFADEIEIELPMKLIIATTSQVNYLEVLDKVRRFNK